MDDKRIYIINGLPRSGKTTFGSLTKGILEDLEINFIHLSSIELVKQLLLHPMKREIPNSIPVEKSKWLLELRNQIVGSDNLYWDGTEEGKDEFWRAKMSELKLAISEKDPYIIPDYLIERALELPAPWVVYIDIREPENIDFMKEYAESKYGIEVRTVLLRSDKEVIADNYSDNSVLNYEYDYTVTNDWYNEGGILAYRKFMDRVLHFVADHIIEKKGFGGVEYE